MAELLGVDHDTLYSEEAQLNDEVIDIKDDEEINDNLNDVLCRNKGKK